VLIYNSREFVAQHNLNGVLFLFTVHSMDFNDIKLQNDFSVDILTENEHDYQPKNEYSIKFSKEISAR